MEVVKSDASSDEVAQTVMEVLRSVGKKPVLCKKDVPGFIVGQGRLCVAGNIYRPGLYRHRQLDRVRCRSL